eukprot:m.37674 g.37674  ORF g.37674 m.37674 type:complete len:546 (+) comp10115_c0_seq6:68-1705(+)
MSNIYIKEPATSGKVLLVTSKGDIDVELWCKECPKTCRNFIQLCMEGYYNGVIFHRVVKGFIAQTGDPSGTGYGGESIYGDPFKDEFHQRLKFNRRGLLGMASSKANDNTSQFFVTLGPTDELTGKHTLFGKVVGNTLFNAMRIGELEVDKDDRPEVPPHIIKTEVLKNPFEDIVPRQLAPRVPTEEDKPKKPKRKVKAVKSFALMSFGDEAEEEAVAIVKASQKLGKIKSAHDVGDDKRLASSAESLEAQRAIQQTTTEDVERKLRRQRKEARKVTAKLLSENAKKPATMHETHSSEDLEAKAFDLAMKDEVLKQRPGYLGSKGHEDETTVETKKADSRTEQERIDAARQEAERIRLEIVNDGKQKELELIKLQKEREKKEKKSLLTTESSQYQRRGGAKVSAEEREGETLSILERFQAKLKQKAASSTPNAATNQKEAHQPAKEDKTSSTGSKDASTEPKPKRSFMSMFMDDGDISSDSDEDVAGADWMTHTLRNETAVVHPEGIDPELDPNSLDLYDPRNPMNQRRRKEAKRKYKSRSSSRR